jgi:hypothetical protein
VSKEVLFERFGLRDRLGRPAALFLSVIALGGTVSACGENQPSDPSVYGEGVEQIGDFGPIPPQEQEEIKAGVGNPCEGGVSDTSSCYDRGTTEEAMGVDSEAFEGKELATIETSGDELEEWCREAEEENGVADRVLPIFETDDPESHIFNYYYC